MGVEVAVPEALSFFNLTVLVLAVVLFVVLCAGIAIADKRAGREVLAFKKSEWLILIGVSAAFYALITIVLNSGDQPARDAVVETSEAVEEHYDVSFVNGFWYDARSDSHSSFNVDFLAENGVIYQGRVDIVDNYATLQVPVDLASGRYIEFSTNETVTPARSVPVQTVSVVKEYADEIALAVIIIIIFSLIAAWKFERYFHDEAVLHGKEARDKGPKRWRWFAWTALGTTGIALFLSLIPGVFIVRNVEANTADATLADLESSYGVSQIKLQDDYFTDYFLLGLDNGLHEASFIDEGVPVSGFVRTDDGETSLYIMEREVDAERVEYSGSLLEGASAASN